MSPAAEGFTLVLCAAASCRPAEPLFAELRESVRASRHGVLVVSGCLSGPVSCRLRPGGHVLLLQPCDADRRPRGPAVRIGPVRTEQDRRDVRSWIERGRFDPHLLPAHLVTEHRRVTAAAAN